MTLRGHSRLLEFTTAQVVLLVHCNYTSISRRFWDTADYWPNIALLKVYLTPPLGVIPSEFRKLRWCGFYSTLLSAVFTKYQCVSCWQNSHRAFYSRTSEWANTAQNLRRAWHGAVTSRDPISRHMIGHVTW